MTEIRINVVINNEEAIQSFNDAIELLEEAVEDAPWNENLKQSLGLLRLVVDSLGLEVADDQDEQSI